jgi:hypothetical protein
MRANRLELYSGQGGRILTTGKLARLLCDDRDKGQRIANLVTYILYREQWGWPMWFQVVETQKSKKVEEQTVLVCSARAMVMNIDIVIHERFKRRGQSHTTDGGEQSSQATDTVV